MNDPSGSHWRRWDLHFHTPKSFDYAHKGLTAADLVAALVKANTHVVAVTDHHCLDADFIKAMRTAAVDALTVLPGIELSSNLGGSEGVHFIGIFPEGADLTHLSNELMGKLDIAQKRKDGVAEDKLYVEFPAAAKVIQDLGGIITIHGHGKAANFENISSRLQFKQQQKTDLLRDYVDIIEVGGLDHLLPYREKIFPAIKFQLPMIVGSDNHDSRTYSVPSPCWIKADPTLFGLRMAIRQPESRFFLGDIPPSVDRLAKNKTRYIKSITFAKNTTMPAGEEWIQGDIPLNPGLVAIIGNKGSGKSALSDCLGLLGSCVTSDAFSFLDDKRFRDPKTGRAQHVVATLNWHDGEPVQRTLSETVAPDEPERVKYLPQNFVETVCNELATPGGGEFERELKKVIFSKVAKADRLEKRSLDELVVFRTHELRAAADSLALGLRELATKRSSLEDKLDPSVRGRLQKRIDQRSEEIKSHEANKPIPVQKPTENPDQAAEAEVQLKKVLELKTRRVELETESKAAEVTQVTQQMKAATAKKLADKLTNLKTEIERQIEGLNPECKSLGLDANKLITISIDMKAVETIRDEALAKRDDAKLAIEGPLPNGLKARISVIEEELKKLQEQLDRPNQEHQAYLEREAAWQVTLDKLRGNNDDPESLQGMEAELKELDGVPALIRELQTQQEEIAKQIHASRLAEAAVYTELYGPVQQFITEHPLAKDHLKLEFKVDLVEDGFTDNLLGHLTQNRIGSFYGNDDGRARAIGLAAPINWSDWANVKAFLAEVVDCLHIDKRTGAGGEAVLLKNQIGKGKTPVDLYTWLYALSYVKPRYLLRCDGKDVGQLSPGERGTLLLVFYLLIDGSDMPLIIDQPEANLDNITVASKLAHCLRDTRTRRQVIIVTHNPNLAVFCDADQIIHATLDKTTGNKMTYKTGALEHPQMNRFAIEVLEGGRVPFDDRDDTYLIVGE